MLYQWPKHLIDPLARPLTPVLPWPKFVAAANRLMRRELKRRPEKAVAIRRFVADYLWFCASIFSLPEKDFLPVLRRRLRAGFDNVRQRVAIVPVWTYLVSRSGNSNAELVRFIETTRVQVKAFRAGPKRDYMTFVLDRALFRVGASLVEPPVPPTLEIFDRQARERSERQVARRVRAVQR